MSGRSRSTRRARITPFASISVSLSVSPTVPPQLATNTTALTLNASQGSGVFASAVSLGNSGGGTITFTASTQITSGGGNWLSLPAAAGTITNAAAFSLPLNIDPSALAAGTYQGLVRVTGTIVDGECRSRDRSRLSNGD